MSDRLGFHGLWFAGGMIGSFVTGSAWPLLAVVICSLAIETVLANRSK